MRAAAQLTSHGFSLGDGLSNTVETWTSQVKTVLQGCAHISNHLDYSKKAHNQDEAEIAASMSMRNGAPMSVSEISKLIH